jgi:hypothetical protein
MMERASRVLISLELPRWSDVDWLARLEIIHALATVRHT